MGYGRVKATVTKLLILANLVMFARQYLVFGSSTDTAALVQAGALYRPLFQPSDVITAFFLHIGPQHLLTNMISLFSIGMVVESILGKWKYFLIYMLSGIGGSLAVLQFAPTTVTAGASSAIFGLMGSALILANYFKNVNGSMLSWIGTIVVYNLYTTFTNPTISVAGHLGGFATGLVVTLIVLAVGRYNPNAGTRHNSRKQTYATEKGRIWR